MPWMHLGCQEKADELVPRSGPAMCYLRHCKAEKRGGSAHHRLLTCMALGWLPWSRGTSLRLGSLWGAHGYQCGVGEQLEHPLGCTGLACPVCETAALAVDQSAESSLAGIGAGLCILMW